MPPPLPARVWPTASSGSVRPGVLPVPRFYAMKSRQQATAERPPAKRRGPKPSISDEALLVAIEADLEEVIPLGGRGTPQGLGSASGLSWHPCFPQAGAPGDAREQPALAPSLPPPWRKSPCR